MARPSETDVVVVGSGAAGLAAAIAASDHGAHVVMIEKAPYLGGTTGVSGGIIWVPGNDHMPEAGVADDRADALRYVKRITLGREPDPELVEVYLDRAPEAVAYLEAHTPLRLIASSVFSDYYADLDGGRHGARSLEPLPFPAGTLAGWASAVRQSPFMSPFTGEELFGSSTVTESSPVSGSVPDQDAMVDLAERRRRDDIRVRGSSLVASLLAGLLDRGIEPAMCTGARRLITEERSVTGVECSGPGGSYSISARRGVVLACGGFEWDDEMVRAYIGHDIEPLSPPYNQGDGHKMALSAGAKLGNMSSYWGQPAMIDPSLEYEGRLLLQFATGRGLPGSIIVNRDGRRFVNEGISYQDFVVAFEQFDPVLMRFPNRPPVWMIFDHRMKSTYPVLSIMPGAPAPEWVVTSPTIGGLAAKLELPSGSLEATVTRFNAGAAKCEDPDFGRGTVWFEGFMSGGPTPEGCIGPLTEPPFYAIPVHHGTIGTNGGVRIDGHGRAMNHDGDPIPGLYAAGNVSACVFGPGYPAGGATIGPALTFGFLAGRHAASRR